MSHEFVISAIALTICINAELLLLYSRRLSAAPAKVSTPLPCYFGVRAKSHAAVLYATATLPRVFSYATVTKKMALSKN